MNERKKRVNLEALLFSRSQMLAQSWTSIAPKWVELDTLRPYPIGQSPHQQVVQPPAEHTDQSLDRGDEDLSDRAVSFQGSSGSPPFSP